MKRLCKLGKHSENITHPHKEVLDISHENCEVDNNYYSRPWQPNYYKYTDQATRNENNTARILSHHPAIFGIHFLCAS